MSRDLLEELWKLGGGSADSLSRVMLTGEDPALPSSFRMGAIAQSSIAASALAAAEFHVSRGGASQQVSVDMMHSAIEFRSEKHMTIDNKPAPRLWDDIAGVYECGDGRWIRLHTNFEHHRNGILKILGCDYDRDAVARALKTKSAFDVENAAAEAGVVSYAMRTTDEWEAHEQCHAVDLEPLVSIEKIGEAPPRERPAAVQPLSGLRVLDLTRIIAGPVCGRTLAAHGADVLRITGPNLPFVPLLVIDAGRGKRSAHVDLKTDAGHATLAGLSENADVFVQGYRPGAIAGRGFDPESVAQRSPGIVYVSLCAWGYSGPWANRRGYDSLVQTASGINLAESDAMNSDQPSELPCQALDHGSGYLMAFGAMRALERQSREGGSWHVRVSLARTGRWIQNAGRIDDGHRAQSPTDDSIKPFTAVSPSGFGALQHITHAATLSETPTRWRYPSTPVGAHDASWAGFDAPA